MITCATLKKVSALEAADIVLHQGLRLAVRSTEPTHKDGLRIRLLGHEPIQTRWDASVWVEAEAHSGQRRSERDITADISALEAHLVNLYAERRGRLIEPHPPCAPETGAFLAPCWGWCSNCGKERIDAAQGDDTCTNCVRSI